MSLTTKFNQADKALDRMTKGTEREIIKAYSASLKKVRVQLSEAYRLHGTGDGLTYGEMQKYNRLAGLEKSIQKELVILNGSNAKTLKQGLGSMFEESYYRVAFALETEVQAKLAYSKINPKVIQASIQNPISGLTLNQTLEKNRRNVIIGINQQITQGLIQGESYQKMTRRVKKHLESDVKKSIRVVQTEAHRVQQDGRMQSYEHAAEQGVIMKKVWTSTLDGDTRDAHQDLDGVEIDLDEDFVSETGSGPAPGQMGSAEDDINCRCSVRTVIKGYEPTQRRARGEGVIPYTTYNEWKENRI